MNKIQDALPDDALRLSEAFRIVADEYARTPRTGTFHHYFKKNIDPDRTLGPDEVDVEAEYLFRECLDAGQIHARVCHPKTGEKLRLASEGWLLEFSAFEDDFLVPINSGPSLAQGTFIEDALRPVFFSKPEFDEWIKSTFHERMSSKNGKYLSRDRPAQFTIRNAYKVLSASEDWKYLQKKEMKARILEYLSKRNLKGASKTIEVFLAKNVDRNRL